MKVAERFDRPSDVKRILLIQLGDIGDVVWFLPVLRAVRESCPEAEVSVLLREGNGALLLADASPPKIFEVWGGKRGSAKSLLTSLGLIRDLIRERFDLVFDFRGHERGAYMAFLTGAPIRATLYYPGLPWPRNQMFTHLVPPVGEPIKGVGAADQPFFILRAFGIETGNAVPELRLSEEVRFRAANILAAEGISPTAEATGEEEAGGTGAGAAGSWVTVNPFSRWSYKEWAFEKWVQVLDWLWGDFGIATVFVGAPAERERADELARGCAGRIYNLAGKTTLSELAGILEQSRLHIGVDSAAPHIAAAVGTPTVTLYGPSDWRYWKPPGDKHRVAFSNMECVPCHQKGCEGSGISRCLDTLEAGRVQEVIHAALSRRPFS